MRIALLSDIHGNLPALQAVLADAARRSVDATVYLGDLLSGPLLPAETADLLMASGCLALAGNHERQVLQCGREHMEASDAFTRAALHPTHLHWMAALPPIARLEDGELLLCHGTPASDHDYLLDSVEAPAPGQRWGAVRVASAAELAARLGPAGEGDGPALIACGHSHCPRILRRAHWGAHGQLLINPGSVGLPAYDHDQPHPHLMQTGSPDARYAIAERREGRWQAELIAVPYDHRAMAALAASRGPAFADWAHALGTGYALA